MKLNTFDKITENFGKSRRMPMLFIGHGHPMNALFDNNFTRSLHQLGKSIEKPNAIIVVSAHWETRGTFVSVNDKPSTIYDFGGFDPKLYEIKYEPEGAPDLAREVIKSAPDFHIQEDHKMGLDHGAWTVQTYISRCQYSGFPNEYRLYTIVILSLCPCSAIEKDEKKRSDDYWKWKYCT